MMLRVINRESNRPYGLRKPIEKNLLEKLGGRFGSDVEEYGGSSIVCRNCGNTITSMEHIIAVNGKHTHTFTNPAGISFEIACFSSASGCSVYGSPVVAFTWFDGFAWNLASCHSCLLHLGWFYQQGIESFFGLILRNLIETAHTH